MKLNLKFLRIIILIFFASHSFHLFASSANKSNSTLHEIVGDDRGPSEMHFNFMFTCLKLNRVIGIEARNYFSGDKIRVRRAEISSMQSNGSYAGSDDLKNVNALIYNESGSAIMRPVVKCDNLASTYYLTFGQISDFYKQKKLDYEVIIENNGRLNVLTNEHMRDSKEDSLASTTAGKNELTRFQGDDVSVAETRFNYNFICDGYNRVVRVEGRNYLSNEGKQRAEITRIQTNGTAINKRNLNVINKAIFHASGSSINAPYVRCNDNWSTFQLAYTKIANKVHDINFLTWRIRNDGSVKVDD